MISVILLYRGLEPGPIRGFAAWFNVSFAGKAGLVGPVVTLSTAPADDKLVPGPWIQLESVRPALHVTCVVVMDAK
jgi:hypothetical protein